MIVKKLFFSALRLFSYAVNCVFVTGNAYLWYRYTENAHAIIIQLSSSCYFKNEIFIAEIMIMRPCQDFVVIIYIYIFSVSTIFILFNGTQKETHWDTLLLSRHHKLNGRNMIGRRYDGYDYIGGFFSLLKNCSLLFIDAMKVK